MPFNVDFEQESTYK